MGGRVVGDTECPQCAANGGDSSKNHLMIFSDGGRYCNRCKYRVFPNGTDNKEVRMTDQTIQDIQQLKSCPMLARGIRQDVAEFYQVKAEYDEAGAEVAFYYPITQQRKVVTYKKRKLPKQFYLVGKKLKGQKVELFGQSVCPTTNKKLLITGGQDDVLAAYQMLHTKYPSRKPSVVGVINGESTYDVGNNLDFLKNFEEIIICMDMDDKGQEAAIKMCQLIGAKAKIMSFSENDPNDMLLEGKSDEFISAFFNAEGYKPEDIIDGRDISIESLQEPIEEGYTLPYPELQNKLHGLRKGEITTLTAGSGIGKSTLSREMVYWLNSHHKLKIGNIFLEENYKKTAVGMIALDNNIPLPKLRVNPGHITPEAYKASHDKLINNGRWCGVNHFGSISSDNLMDKMRYLAMFKGSDFIWLDHLSMVISGQESNNERKDIDLLMTNLAAFVNETGVGVVIVVHLSRNRSKDSFNEGGQISLQDLRGSGALEQLSWNVLAMERNQQKEAVENISTLRLLKNREWGFLGEAGRVEYVPETGRLLSYEDDGSF